MLTCNDSIFLFFFFLYRKYTSTYIMCGAHLFLIMQTRMFVHLKTFSHCSEHFVRIYQNISEYRINFLFIKNNISYKCVHDNIYIFIYIYIFSTSRIRNLKASCYTITSYSWVDTLRISVMHNDQAVASTKNDCRSEAPWTLLDCQVFSFFFLINLLTK
jgi:hypothetical protein